MKAIVYFDSGTTNSRAYLLAPDGTLMDQERASVGSRDSAIARSNAVLIDGLYALYLGLLERNGLRGEDIERIFASGMVTSPYGLCEIPHVEVPIRFADFPACVVPFWEGRRFARTLHLIPGLRTAADDISRMNNLRGEEIEALGAAPRVLRESGGEPVAMVLPGSHTHTILMRSDGFYDLLACFTGELYQALAKETILSPVLSASVAAYDPEMIALGVENLRKYGFTRALYICHAMRILGRETPERRASYGEGVILGGVCQALDEKCETGWRDVTKLAIIAQRETAELYRMVLANCRTPLHISVFDITQEWTPALEGMRSILRAQEGNGLG